MTYLARLRSSLVRVNAYPLLGILIVGLITQTQTKAVHISTVSPSYQTTPTFIVQNGEGTKLLKPEEIRSIIQQAAKAWMAGDADAVARLFLPDGVLIVPGHLWVKATAIRQVAAEFAATHSDVKIEIKQILIEGNHAVVEWSWQDTEKATGLRQKAEDAIAVDFKEGRISRWREYIDTETNKKAI